MSFTFAAPSWKAATFCMPLVGNQPSVMENSTMSIRPAQNTGVAYASTVSMEMRWSCQGLRLRASVLEQFSMDYVVTARAKGLTERQIARRHVLRNAVLPVLTMAGVQVGALLGGSVVVETVFAWPGLGLLAYESLFARDLNLLLGIFFVSTCLVIVVNLLVDVAYSLLDPRIDLR